MNILYVMNNAYTKGNDLAGSCRRTVQYLRCICQLKTDQLGVRTKSWTKESKRYVMYSYEERLKAVELYIKYNNNSAAVIRELGYPNRGTLRLWVKEFNQEGSLHEKYKDKSKYSDEQRKYALNYYL